MFRGTVLKRVQHLSLRKTLAFQESSSIRICKMSSSGSKVPESVQDKLPKDVKEAAPDQIHPTKGDGGQSTNKSHALGGGSESIVPQKLQEILPESIERAVPNKIHNTGDKK
ncbi:hypothetical protein E4U43_000288 [Claviceps pusilla]|uniref:Uncharacterized protein n=1 Tax=Claviceps pusilla TaxID=123648 RepID=A0A9P7T0A0_9HYPO|nr:hypothetical protein E4U43_000288 [Claviceps pusilla]